MARFSLYFKKLSKSKKIILLVSLIVTILMVSFYLPTLARFKNRVKVEELILWDGSVATSYHSGNGTKNNPYIIMNGSELAYFASQLETNDYSNTYFALGNSILLNNGIFNYDSSDLIEYILNENTYYIDYYTNNYYDNINMDGTPVGNINIFNSLNGFKGYFDGKSYTIYGLYITSENNDKLGLFNDLEGEVKDLYVENALIFGGVNTGGIASTAKNSKIENVLFNGHVIGKRTEITKNIVIDGAIEDIKVTNDETLEYIDLSNMIPFVGSEIISSNITGNYTITGGESASNTIKINGNIVTGGTFDINLGTNILEKIEVIVETDSLEEVTISFSNIKYNVVYKHGIAGGIVAVSNNTEINNSINKAYVSSYSVSGGIIGASVNNFVINRSYNTGQVISQNISAGLIGVVEKNTSASSINKSYNAGTTSIGLIGVLKDNDTNVSIKDSFNGTLNYSIGSITNTVVSIDNSYIVTGTTPVNNGSVTGSFTSTSLSNLRDKTFLINNLHFNEFISFEDLETNTNNVWVYENDKFPIIFVDDITDPIATLNTSVYSWNNFSNKLNQIKLSTNITFTISEVNVLKPIKEMYYYIKENNVPLSIGEVKDVTEWVEFDGPVQITEEGYYIIYAKVVDYDDNEYYLNTDILLLDVPGIYGTVSLDDYSWSNLRSTLEYIYVSKEKKVIIDIPSQVSELSSLEYYISNQILSKNQLDDLNSSSWNEYNDGILIDDKGIHIVYVKLVDSNDVVTYINTDYIVYNGYEISNFNIGRNASSYNENSYNITDKSIITFDVKYSNSESNYSGYTHNLISNILLPKNTKINIFDKINNKVYEYIIPTEVDNYNYNDSCDNLDENCKKRATYPLTLFYEVGTSSNNKMFVENSYFDSGEIEEDFTIVVDFSSANITNNYTDVELYLELHSNDLVVRPTLDASIVKFNIYDNLSGGSAKANIYLNTDYSGSSININSDSTINIDLTTGISYKSISGKKIFDTTYEDKKLGLMISIVDSDDNLVDRKDYANLLFKIDDEVVSPGKDNIIRINLGKATLEEMNNTLSITTSSSDNIVSLVDGTYYLKINSYVADDGYYYNNLNTQEISIPISVFEPRNNNNQYGFDVVIPDENRIITKLNPTISMPFNISYKGNVNNPSIKVALYKKQVLSATNQNYVLVDLASFVTDQVTLYDNNIYNLISSPNRNNSVTLTFDTTSLEYNGYELVFYLYSNNKKVATIEKKFIVK